MLDRFFFKLPATKGAACLGQEAMIGQYAHGNEPSHHIAWLYAFTDAPEVGHGLIARIVNDSYKDDPAGIICNEDAGQMSAWYVFATLGFYPVEPASGTYVSGIPLVRRALMEVPGRPALTIERIGDGNRLASVKPRGIPLNTTAIKRRQLAKAGTLLFATEPTGI